MSMFSIIPITTQPVYSFYVRFKGDSSWREIGAWEYAWTSIAMNENTGWYEGVSLAMRATVA